MKSKLLILSAIFLLILIYIGYAPVREFYSFPEYTDSNDFVNPAPPINSNKPTILLIADNQGTEIFDLMAPFYLFSLTGQANVLIVASTKSPIIVMKGVFALPHYTFKEIDSLRVNPALMIIPALSPMDKKHQDPALLAWIRSHYTTSTKMLSVCWGAITAGSTGLYNGKSITTHATGFDDIKKQFPDLVWESNKSVTKSGNLYSTAGVSNAVEGSLVLIGEMFGNETVRAVMDSIHYPHSSPKLDHRSIGLNTGLNMIIARKIYLQKNRKVGVLLHDGIDEFDMAAVLDTYHRTFPNSLESFTVSGKSIRSKHNLTLLPTGNIKDVRKLDELHLFHQTILTPGEITTLSGIPTVSYQSGSKIYIIEECLKRIRAQYGPAFESNVKQLLDYN